MKLTTLKTHVNKSDFMPLPCFVRKRAVYNVTQPHMLCASWVRYRSDETLASHVDLIWSEWLQW